MKLTYILYRQHIDRMFKKHWRIQGKRTPIDTGAEKELKALGIPVYNPQYVIKDKTPDLRVHVVGFASKPIPLDASHPNWHDKVCYFHRDNNVLLLGIDQAKTLTKTIEIQNGLPEKIQNAPILSKEINVRAAQIIMSSHLFDTQQEKLPKIKDPNRPAWNFPRTLGITNAKINQLITSKLLQLCESSSTNKISCERMVLNDARFFVPFQKSENLIQLELSANQLLMSTKPLEPITNDFTESIDVPNLSPVKHTITLVPENIYEVKNVYPLKSNILKYHPHTVFVHFDNTEVKNIFEEVVTEPQILGRSLMKTFTVAASYARRKFGNNVKVLPKPITLQCIQTDGQMFHFGILQLNTLNLDEGGTKNIWYSIPRLPLFTKCEYKVGKPILEGYNQDVMKYLMAFYHNV